MSGPTCEAPASDRTEADFMSGKALAVQMLQSAVDHDIGTDQCELSCRYRTAPQVNFVAPFLRRLREHPEWEDGFSAAMSDALVEGVNAIGVAPLDRLTYQQITGPYPWPVQE